jgi:valyl-tRNA synthetase
MSFGTGAVKITPAHDPNDFATGKRHNLPSINVFTDQGMMNENGAPYEGMQRFAVRVKVCAALLRWSASGVVLWVEDQRERW